MADHALPEDEGVLAANHPPPSNDCHPHVSVHIATAIPVLLLFLSLQHASVFPVSYLSVILYTLPLYSLCIVKLYRPTLLCCVHCTLYTTDTVFRPLAFSSHAGLADDDQPERRPGSALSRRSVSSHAAHGGATIQSSFSLSFSPCFSLFVSVSLCLGIVCVCLILCHAAHGGVTIPCSFFLSLSLFFFVCVCFSVSGKNPSVW